MFFFFKMMAYLNLGQVNVAPLYLKTIVCGTTRAGGKMTILTTSAHFRAQRYMVKFLLFWFTSLFFPQSSLNILKCQRVFLLTSQIIS